MAKTNKILIIVTNVSHQSIGAAHHLSPCPVFWDQLFFR
jgi:hypothetical protein